MLWGLVVVLRCMCFWVLMLGSMFIVVLRVMFISVYSRYIGWSVVVKLLSNVLKLFIEEFYFIEDVGG